MIILIVLTGRKLVGVQVIRKINIRFLLNYKNYVTKKQVGSPQDFKQGKMCY